MSIVNGLETSENAAKLFNINVISTSGQRATGIWGKYKRYYYYLIEDICYYLHGHLNKLHELVVVRRFATYALHRSISVNGPGFVAGAPAAAAVIAVDAAGGADVAIAATSNGYWNCTKHCTPSPLCSVSRTTVSSPAAPSRSSRRTTTWPAPHYPDGKCSWPANCRR